MATSSTTYSPKWRSGKTKLIRVPEALEEDILRYAEFLDAKEAGEEVAAPAGGYTVAPRRLNPRKPVNVASVPLRSPFRYPGGKTWLVPYLRRWLSARESAPALFVEPFAGGGIASLTAAFEDLAGHVLMAELDANVAAVWKTVLMGQAEWLARRILEFDLTVENIKAALSSPDGGDPPLREKAFLTILRNRVQRGGIMAPGAGLMKTGENGRGIASRWYPETLARRIREIDLARGRLSFLEGDGMALFDQYRAEPECVFFVDPPYTKAARRLYQHWQFDHRRLFERLTECEGDFLMSYDNTAEIADLAQEFGFQQQPVCMKNTHNAEMTELLIGKDLSWFGQSAADS